MRIFLFLFTVTILVSASYGATGKVQFKGSMIDSGNIYLDSVCANTNDDTLSTFWGAGISGQWCGMDMGAAVTLSSVQIIPRTDDAAGACDCWNRAAGQNVIEASNDPAFASGTVTLDTLTAFPYISQLQYNTRPEIPGSTYRYFRLRSPVGFGDTAELGWIGNAQNGVNARPVMPAIAPWGGVYLGGSTSVMMASLTTNAALHLHHGRYGADLQQHSLQRFLHAHDSCQHHRGSEGCCV